MACVLYALHPKQCLAFCLARGKPESLQQELRVGRQVRGGRPLTMNACEQGQVQGAGLPNSDSPLPLNACRTESVFPYEDRVQCSDESAGLGVRHSRVCLSAASLRLVKSPL